MAILMPPPCGCNIKALIDYEVFVLRQFLAEQTHEDGVSVNCVVVHLFYNHYNTFEFATFIKYFN